MNRKQLATAIDYSLLRPEATYAEVRKACAEAKKLGFHAVCVFSQHVGLARKALGKSSVKIVATVGYPHGNSTIEAKVQEAYDACAAGAQEIDLVMSITAFKSRDYAYVEREITAVAEEAHAQGALLKVIIETGYLTPKEIAAAAKLVERGGADFVKTCTGYGPRGATVADVKTIKRATRLPIKASAGIRTAAQATALLKAGASRIGTSHGPQVIGK
ncbi:MAG: deoxyribose-phosphate aldolase [Candidatus Micrarchaeota archaeon]